MFVVQLIGREAGTIQEQPYSAATSNIAAGTARAPTEAELEAANLLQPGGSGEAAPEGLPEGYVTKPNEHGGYDLFAPNGDQVNDQPFPNLPAARSMANAHAGAAQPLAADLENMKATELKDFAAAKKIDLGNAKTKAEILDVIKAALSASQQSARRIVAVDGSEEFFDVVDGDGVKINNALLTKEEAETLAANSGGQV